MENDTRPDPYEAVLADLRAQRERIDQAISVLQALRMTPGARELLGTGGIGAAVASGHKATGPVPELGPGAFLGMSIVDAAKKLLASQRRQMSTADIVREIERGGVVLTSADKVNTVGSVLLRRFNQYGDIVRVNRGVWGLSVWYPGRKFPKTAAGAKTDENGPKENREESEAVGNEEETNPNGTASFGDASDLM